MTLRHLPDIRAFENTCGLSFEPDADALERWNAGVRSAHEGDDTVISVYGVIGEDPWSGDGVTSRRVAAALRRIGAKDVTVNINSPGGDFFEGVAIYSLLREHPHQVTVKVMGLAASAASVIAMAGDRIEVSEVGFFMVHNAWAVAIGNRHDLRQAADTLEPFDDAMASLYAARAAVGKDDAVAWMDAETWFNGQGAVDAGLADAILSADEVSEGDTGSTQSLAAVRRIDAALAKQGISRSERRSLIGELKGGKPGAAVTVTQDADDIVSALNGLRETLKI